MAKPIHSMIRVMNEARSVDFYQRAFGMETADRFPFDSFTLVYLRSPEDDFELELTINHDRTEPYTHGQGYGHIAFVVPDVVAEQARMVAAGLNPEPVKEFHREGALMARFFFVTDPDGYRIEVLQRHGRYR
jgi:lactoylglutathione lyase